MQPLSLLLDDRYHVKHFTLGFLPDGSPVVLLHACLALNDRALVLQVIVFAKFGLYFLHAYQVSRHVVDMVVKKSLKLVECSVVMGELFLRVIDVCPHVLDSLLVGQVLKHDVETEWQLAWVAAPRACVLFAFSDLFHQLFEHLASFLILAKCLELLQIKVARLGVIHSVEKLLYIPW